MIKKITVGDRSLLLSAGAGALIHYKKQFGTEYTDDFSASRELSGTDKFEKIAETEMRLLWAMAKAADKTISPPEEWLTSFDAAELFTASQAARDFFMASLEDYGGKPGSGQEFTSENLIASALVCGLTLDDLDEMPLPMVLDTVSEWCKLKGYAEQDARPATQADFDAL